MARKRGKIKRIVGEKGFGFITDDGGTEFFFHRSGAADFDLLLEGDSVSFEVTTAPKGPRAEDVRKES